jgi:hypothetical protein
MIAAIAYTTLITMASTLFPGPYGAPIPSGTGRGWCLVMCPYEPAGPQSFDPAIFVIDAVVTMIVFLVAWRLVGAILIGLMFVISIVVAVVTLNALFGVRNPAVYLPLVLWAVPLFAGGFSAWVVSEIRAIGRDTARAQPPRPGSSL